MKESDLTGERVGRRDRYSIYPLCLAGYDENRRSGGKEDGDHRCLGVVLATGREGGSLRRVGVFGADPPLTAVTTPPLLTLATDASLELNTTTAVGTTWPSDARTVAESEMVEPDASVIG